MPTAPNPFPKFLPLAVDLALSPSGDLMLDETGDLRTVGGMDCLLQEIEVRLRTKQGDNRIIPLCGASLDTLVGQPNGPLIETQARQLILRALTYDGLFAEADVTVEAWPMNATQVGILITCELTGFSGIPDGEESVTLNVTLDLQEGLLS